MSYCPVYMICSVFNPCLGNWIKCLEEIFEVEAVHPEGVPQEGASEEGSDLREASEVVPEVDQGDFPRAAGDFQADQGMAARP